jgi:hypothetical protein
VLFVNAPWRGLREQPWFGAPSFFGNGNDPAISWIVAGFQQIARIPQVPSPILFRSSPMKKTCPVLLICALLPACSSSAANSPKKDEASEIRTEREKLLQEKLDLERQRADFERQQREALEKKVQEQEVAAKSKEFTPSEMTMLKKYIESNGESLGRALQGGTHPTGQYISSGTPIVVLSTDRLVLTVTLTVNWKGGVSEANYQTTYRSTVDKTNGIGHLRVIQDSALFQITPEQLLKTEDFLKTMFKPDR